MGAAVVTCLGGVPPAHADSTTIALIGDYGWCDSDQRRIAEMVAGWVPAWVVTAGDNYQNVSRCTAYDLAVDQYYGSFVAAQVFYPALGNHDYNPNAGLDRYNAYFDHLPTTVDPQRRWYDVVLGDVHFFVLDSQAALTSAADAQSQQAWLSAALPSSTSAWDIVVFHHPAHSSLGSTVGMQWDFAAWGADVVISGHQHVYERIARDGIHYFTNGLGGLPGHTCPATRIDGSEACIGDSGAMRLTTSPEALTIEYLVDDQVMDAATVTPSGNLLPEAEFTPTVSGLQATVDGSASTDPDGHIAGYSWDFGDGSAPRSGVSATHAYAQAGRHTVTLTVTDDDGADASVTREVLVAAPPEASGPPAPGAAEAGAVAIAPPTVRARVRAVAGASKLRVNVNPNKATGYWTFEVQRLQPDNTWQGLRTYRTKGKKDTRTINLRKGTYRVRVNPKYGRQGTTSAAVSLRK